MAYDWTENEYREPKDRNPSARRGETAGLVKIGNDWYGLGSNEPVKVRNERYEPRLLMSFGDDD